MLGLLASLVLSVLPAMPSASVTCAEGPASCDGAWPAAAVAAEAGTQAEPGDYATPAEVDCPTPAPGAAVVAGACDEAPPVDLWYRVSQDPDSERVAPTLAPARRAHGRAAASCGTPPADPGHLTPPDVQPLALCAAPVLVLEDSPSAVVSDSLTLPARVLAPLERPPRA